MPDIPEQYRARAKEYRRLAELSANLAVAEELSQLALAYEEEARRIGRLPRASSSALQ
jgi:hypothetical protein